VAFDPQSGRIEFHRAFAPGTRCSCPQCGAEHPPVHDTLERDWRHLNCFQFQACIHAKVPRVRCHSCARTTPRPWRPGRAPTAASAYGWRPYWTPSVRRWRSLRSLKLPGVSDGHVWRTLDHYVDQAHAQEDFSTVTSAGLDETRLTARTQ